MRVLVRTVLLALVFLILPLVSPFGFAEPMMFTSLGRCEDVGRFCGLRVLAAGEIEWDTVAELRAFLAAHQHGTSGDVEICFDSPGGDLDGALKLGNLIRSLGLDTCVEAGYSTHRLRGVPISSIGTQVLCASACVFALAAGVHRTVESGARVGVHQFSGLGSELGERRAQLTVAQLGQYLERNGVQRKLLDIAAYVPPQSMRFLNDREIVEINLANTAQVYAGWKLSSLDDGVLVASVDQSNPITDGRTLLTLQQTDGTARLDIIYYPPPISNGAETFNVRKGLAQALNEAGVWLRVDENDLADLPSAPWTYRSDGGHVRTHRLTINQVAALRTHQVLEVWILVPDGMRDNPSMSFNLSTLHPLLKVVLK